ncbi:MAG: RnfABCDGE type electron transport complex subunit G [Spirochaeta sp.]
MSDSKQQNKASTMIGVLTVIAVLSGAALGFTDYLTRDIIQANRIETQMSAVRQVLPEYQNEPIDEQWAHPEFEENYVFPARDGEGSIIGLAVQSRVGSGYSGDISAIVGMEPDGRVVGVVILQHSETPGLGARITEEEFTRQFDGVNPATDPPRLVRDGGDIDAIAAATISSRAVVEVVERAGVVYEDYMAAMQGGDV